MTAVTAPVVLLLVLTPFLVYVLNSATGVVKSTKMTRTIVVRRDYLHYIKKYAR